MNEMPSAPAAPVTVKQALERYWAARTALPLQEGAVVNAADVLAEAATFWLRLSVEAGARALQARHGYLLADFTPPWFEKVARTVLEAQVGGGGGRDD